MYTMENQHEDDPYTCPSFSSYSSDRLSEIAAGFSNVDAAFVQYEDDDEDFEFALARYDTEVLADEFVGDGQSGSIFPVFGGQLEAPLSKLFIGGGENNPGSCSSSEADESENIPAGWNCVWRPKVVDQPAESGCRKSKSTGSASRKWKFCDLLRSNSEGAKDSLVLLPPKNRPVDQVPRKQKGKGVRSGRVAPSAHEELYVRNRSIMEGNKKKTYLPYRRDLLGFFGN